MSALRVAAPARNPSPVARACGTHSGDVCRFVFDHTSSSSLAKVAVFLVDRPLKVVVICLVAWVLSAITRRLIQRFVNRITGIGGSERLRAGADGSGRLVDDGSGVAGSGPVPGESPPPSPRLLGRVLRRAPEAVSARMQPSLRSTARAQTIGQVLRSVSSAVIYTFAAIYAVAACGLQLAPLIAGAGVAGVAIGFGAQSLVKDFLSGVFMLIEDQYGVGDVIDCGVASGTVEAVTLRTTRLRDVDGTVWHVPNGEIQRVGNKSQQWARAVLDVLVGTGTDVDQAEALLLAAATDRCAAPDLAADVIEPPEMWGVDSLGPEGITLRLVVKTRPGGQWNVLRALRVVIHQALMAGGIQVPASPGTITVIGADSDATPDQN